MRGSKFARALWLVLTIFGGLNFGHTLDAVPLSISGIDIATRTRDHVRHIVERGALINRAAVARIRGRFQHIVQMKMSALPDGLEPLWISKRVRDNIKMIRSAHMEADLADGITKFQRNFRYANRDVLNEIIRYLPQAGDPEDLHWLWALEGIPTGGDDVLLRMKIGSRPGDIKHTALLSLSPNTIYFGSGELRPVLLATGETPVAGLAINAISGSLWNATRLETGERVSNLANNHEFAQGFATLAGQVAHEFVPHLPVRVDPFSKIK